MNYQVIVGNIGTVYSGRSSFDADKKFLEYKKQSESGHGRAGNEPVTLMIDGDVFKEHIPIPTKMIVAGHNSNDEPDLFFVIVNGPPTRTTIAKARNAAKEAGYGDQLIVFTELDSAGRAMIPLFDWDTADTI